eukprot:4614832-Amphidinium_carterae.2
MANQVALDRAWWHAWPPVSSPSVLSQLQPCQLREISAILRDVQLLPQGGVWLHDMPGPDNSPSGSLILIRTWIIPGSLTVIQFPKRCGNRGSTTRLIWPLISVQDLGPRSSQMLCWESAWLAAWRIWKLQTACSGPTPFAPAMCTAHLQARSGLLRACLLLGLAPAVEHIGEAAHPGPMVCSCNPGPRRVEPS